jgi:hypothetical protein
MASNLNAPRSDVRLQGNRVSILGDHLLLENSLLMSHAKSLWLNRDRLLVTWDLQKAQTVSPDPHRPHEEGHVVAFEADIEASDVVLVQFERVDAPPLPDDLRDDVGDDDLRAPIDPDGGAGEGDDRFGERRTGRPATTGAGVGDAGRPLDSIFDVDPPPTTVRRTISLLDSIRGLEQRNEDLRRRLADLEDRVRRLEVG